MIKIFVPSLIIYHQLSDKVMNVFSDITFYYHGKVLDGKYRRSPFRLEMNYISDYFHRLVVKNKPPNTVRFLIILTPEDRSVNKPIKDGANCLNRFFIDEDQYLASSKPQRYTLLLDYIMNSFEDCKKAFGWDIKPYQKAYQQIKHSDFRFVISSKEKKSPDRKKTGNICIKKDERTTMTFIQITTPHNQYEQLISEGENYNCFDPQYNFLKYNKWFSKDEFGVYFKSKTDRITWKYNQVKNP